MIIISHKFYYYNAKEIIALVKINTLSKTMVGPVWLLGMAVITVEKTKVLSTVGELFSVLHKPWAHAQTSTFSRLESISNSSMEGFLIAQVKSPVRFFTGPSSIPKSFRCWQPRKIGFEWGFWIEKQTCGFPKAKNAHFTVCKGCFLFPPSKHFKARHFPSDRKKTYKIEWLICSIRSTTYLGNLIKPTRKSLIVPCCAFTRELLITF